MHKQDQETHMYSSSNFTIFCSNPREQQVCVDNEIKLINQSIGFHIVHFIVSGDHMHNVVEEQFNSSFFLLQLC
jgi:hypothetical protein